MRAQQHNTLKPFLRITLILVTSCSTARRVLYGTGTALERMVTNARTVGNWIK